MRAVQLFWLGGGPLLLAVWSSACSKSDHLSCTSDSDCPASLVCGNYVRECIVPQCISDKECGRGQICTPSRECKTGCDSDDACGEGLVCEFTLEGPPQCVPGCRTDNACSERHVCAGQSFGAGRCVEGCRTNADCPPRTFCTAAASQEDAASPLGEVVDRCASGCHDDGECASTTLCIDGECASRCERASDCRAGESCAALHYSGEPRADDAGMPLTCGAGERCRCIQAPSPNEASHPSPTSDGGADARSPDSGETAP
jgi:hypothetical protein